MSKITSLQIYDKPILLQAAKSEPYFQGPDLLYDNNNKLCTPEWCPVVDSVLWSGVLQ